MRPKTRSATPEQFATGRDDAVEPEADFGGFAAHLQMDVAGARALGLLRPIAPEFEFHRRGFYRARLLWFLTYTQFKNNPARCRLST